jgi:uncharacterized protein YjgD (DUF1641 family)
METDLVILNQKIDYLTEMMEAQRKRQLELEELQHDMVPIVNSMIKLSIDELAEIGNDFQVEDLLFLFKRLLRDTNILIDMIDRLEAVHGLAQEVELMGKPMFNQVVEWLDKMERDGYFDFARGGWKIMERIVSEFDEEDIDALGDNVVTILTTIRNMTQPEILAIANNAVGAISEEPAEIPQKVSTWMLLKEMSNPEVRRGLLRMLEVVKVLGEQPVSSQDQDQINQSN